MSIPIAPLQSLKRIESWVADRYPDRLPFLRPPADASTVERIERRLKLKLPDDVRNLYAAYDGQPEGAPTLYLNQRWLPLDLVAVAWEDLCLRYGRNVALRRAANTDSPFPMQTTGWSALWLPLFGSPRGDHYCLDLWPGRPNRFGQIIWFLYDRPERMVIASSLSQLLRRVADGLDKGEWCLEAGFDGLSD
ncbi:MAG: SMI1/KNR4 family protein [Chelatococcus sp.]|jgi:cell wall assembly regulator SMI1|uniref:SMI1/KNR4 family protein n=1 Tax=Chelatococcus sp. TaxID=1953771 RepID=UPI0025BC0869|nr:SMI1/KNR4 family protein [Chelatococcus sp.]MBX3536677.1 SMI1/KNR4 family protein [Chelatococcus sp.]